VARTVVWSYFGSRVSLGQRKYEIEIRRAMRAAADGTWSFVDRPLVPIRTRRVRGRRFSARVALQGSWPTAVAMGGVTFRTPKLVHRFDLRLPPGLREVLTVHDLPPARFSDEGTVPASAADSVKRARAVVCPSQFAANELSELLGAERLVVIPYGVSDPFRNARAASLQELERLGIARPFILHAAGATTRKNLPALAAAWVDVASAHANASLVLCGPPDARRTRAFEGLPRVQLLGYQAPNIVAGLTAASAAVVVPSLYEGFGLPALEGMACGVPVVAARRGALPEVCGHGALLVEPDADGLAEGLIRVLTDDQFAYELGSAGRERAAAFSWDRAARDHLSLYERVLERALPEG
jgi:glycosyltransferase involved in cell wall biosynthesis